jgi:seryl-tRNA synthetase
MLDIQLLRKDAALVAERLAARGFVFDTARFDALEAERKTIQTRTQDAQSRRNALSKQIGMLKGKGEDTAAVMAEVAGLGMNRSSWKDAPVRCCKPSSAIS